KWLYLACFFMIIFSIGFILMQKTAMSYTVGINRVVFLPMVMYGIVISVLISVFVSEEFDDGFIKNKIIANNNRREIYLTGLLSNLIASLIVYIITALFTLIVSYFLFSINISIWDYISYFLFGIYIMLVFVGIFYFVSIVVGKKSKAIIINMGLAFILLIAALIMNGMLMADNNFLVQILFDLNPYGQTAQLTSMVNLDMRQSIKIDGFLFIIFAVLGIRYFNKKDIN
ncbi:MAG: ABC transporter permease subunit, partial [Methanobrevibacter sp.]|nr:ABC transporter permease subunit [Methanobrevibacter sp.]